MMHNLRVRQEHINERIGNFGSRRLGGDSIDKKIEEDEKIQRRGRTLCNDCHTMKSVSGSCYC